MTTVNMFQAKSTLSKLVEAVESGETQEVIIARNGKAAVRIVPLQNYRQPVRLGLAKGEFTVPDDIDECNEEVLALFEKGGE
ncbi:MAG: type II toxin-antitoxin system prevent-host-death family antitoxin [Paludibacterium sp.]|uniref:type II toxin-antitoxin system Phd/YefM family antitoxin n=1 Tax=Paludibacterium sp. TaxID=1917523 RepID=UPI0025CF8CCB|nr:type II toxin-antitoxin system prevent-host-death family antitoxin [Paludibacterium sp.]MBV8048679.1 type II toxin-antitoxin system prevent-host-death family antitoxin [Paludibacterium sp.]MBV8645984.1 type II toxin-antitoxin system prevent-host-death family antitoxin [Paludibacterium sp.]